MVCALVDWLSLLRKCSQRMRDEVLPLVGKAKAGIGFGVGAGGDIMKRIDLVAEEALVKTLQDYDASCTVISEESGVREVGSEPSRFYLTVDPLDGTTNAVRGVPFMAISIAGSKRPRLQDVEVALVADPIHDVVYTAEKGQGAFRNKRRIKPSSTASLREAVVGIDFNAIGIERLAARLRSLLRKTKHFRHLGANALEICYVADGTIDAFIDVRGKLRVTDVAAAYLILLEAGGIMTTPDGKNINIPLSPQQRVSFIAVGNPILHDAILRMLS